MPYIKPTRVIVEVKRGLTQTNFRAVFEHEVPILEEIHGQGNIAIVEPPYPVSMVPPPQLEHPIDAHVEYQRLCEKYGMHPEIAESNCENVYGKWGNGKAFCAAAGGIVKEEQALKEIEDYEQKMAQAETDKVQARMRAIRGAA